MEARIDHLFDHPVHIPRVAGWIYREFWQGRPGYSVQTFERLLADASGRDRVPLSLLALVDGSPVGTVNLVDNDDPGRPNLRPWLAALVVVPEHRRHGIGSELVRRLIGEARRLGFSELFLGTDIPSFYRRLGADHHEQRTDTLSIMKFAL
jgi:predicted N-acetyltransferase YhbS